ncbi:MAG: hypothetical protein B6I38_07025 [Anaerolineaceae bacterium 4572_5.1]|nr:MAG: hypothetical protein B6I38_07025 [Anaerolineaceae bacterium 4572_5.1]
MKKLIKIYGERNTNTNYISKLISLNLDVQEAPGVAPRWVLRLQNKLPGDELVRDIYFRLAYKNTLGWKHTRVKPAADLKKYRIVNNNLSFVTITKNPYSWLLSLYRRPYHQYYSGKPSFEDFLQTPWKTIARDNIQKPVNNPMEMWNLKNASYLHLPREFSALNITTESIFVNPADVVDLISSKLSIEKSSAEFIDYEKSTKDKSKDTYYYRDYYLNEKWKTQLSSEAIAIINDSIDKNLMAHFGYTVLG